MDVLSDEVRQRQGLFFRQAVLLLAIGNRPHQKDHISGKRAHLLQSFGIFERFAWRISVNAVPVLALRNHHAHREIFVELVIRRCCSTAACGHDGRANLHRDVELLAVKQPVKDTKDSLCLDM